MNEGSVLRNLPPEATIEIWRIDLDGELDHEAHLDNILSIEERNRAERFIFPRDAHRFRLCRAMLRLGLAGYLEENPQKIALATNRHGKPRLADGSALHFNVMHSEGLGLIAFTAVGEVGIDVEATERDVEALDIASASFTRNEAAVIAAARTPQEQTGIFLRIWTRKEAVLKAAGYGILEGLDTVDVSQPHLNLVRLPCASDERTGICWRVQDLTGIDGFTGAVAAPEGDWMAEQRRVSYADAIHDLNARFPGLL
jgi:4'-phosphopantetheinyl transferase